MKTRNKSKLSSPKIVGKFSPRSKMWGVKILLSLLSVGLFFEVYLIDRRFLEISALVLVVMLLSINLTLRCFLEKGYFN